MASTIANDGIYTPARIVAGSIAPRATLQTVVFKPAQQRRVVSPLTAVEMKKILEEVVLFGTGKKAILDGYTSGGKTGTAQKIDPASGRYSATKYIASFAGFAPVAQPAITISVMLDSPQGGHHGGDVGAPLFGRVAQQVLAYMNVPHDADVKNPQRLMLRASAKESDFSEGSPDRLSGDTEIADASVEPEPANTMSAKPVDTKKQADRAKLLAASFTPAKQAPVAIAKTEPVPAPSVPQPSPTRGTVILDAGGGPTAPSLIGKTVRAAIESAQDAGVEIYVVGSGVARAQAPAAGERVPPGTRVVVKFSR
jgi:cell division protein FtsI (penicillin-binding protein 3)